MSAARATKRTNQDTSAPVASDDAGAAASGTRRAKKRATQAAKAERSCDEFDRASKEEEEEAERAAEQAAEQAARERAERAERLYNEVHKDMAEEAAAEAAAAAKQAPSRADGQAHKGGEEKDDAKQATRAADASDAHSEWGTDADQVESEKEQELIECIKKVMEAAAPAELAPLIVSQEPMFVFQFIDADGGADDAHDFARAYHAVVQRAIPKRCLDVLLKYKNTSMVDSNGKDGSSKEDVALVRAFYIASNLAAREATSMCFAGISGSVAELTNQLEFITLIRSGSLRFDNLHSLLTSGLTFGGAIQYVDASEAD